GDVFGWRGIFVVLGLFGLIVAVAAFFAFRNVAASPSKPFSLAAVRAGFRSVFADPRAKVCFGSVFCEAVFIHGLFPYVAILLLFTGETRASMAGIVIAAFGLGGLIYSLSVPVLVANVRERSLMLIGGAIAAVSLLLTAIYLPWYQQAPVFCMFG